MNDLPALNQKPCLICGEPTSGSVGSAGICYNQICQFCKDSEDEALRRQVRLMKKTMDFVTEKLFGQKKD